MKDLLNRFASLPAEQRALALKKLQRQHQAVAIDRPTQTPPIQRAPRDGMLPLSFSQERLWFLDQLEPDKSAYNLPPGMVQIAGPLDVQALEQALDEVARRHEALRTTFAAVKGQPVQIISPSLRVPLRAEDLRDLPDERRAAEARRIALEEAHYPFSLTQGPLLRAALLHLGDDQHLFCLNMHHIISDFWSMYLLQREVATLYQAFATGEPSPLPALPIQYADYAIWQRQQLQGQVLETLLAYWERQLAGAPPRIDLPTDRPRPSSQTFRGGNRRQVIAGPLMADLRALGREEGATLFMTLLAGLATLLYHYTGQEDICVGSYIAGRNRSEIENLIGFFVNTLVYRIDLSGQPRFRELLARAREVALQAYAHQELPFEQLLEAVQPERNLDHTPLFQVMLVLHNVPSAEVELASGLKLASPPPTDPVGERANFDLTWWMTEVGEELHGYLEYNADLFDADTAERMVCHFQTVLERAVTDPDLRIGELTPLSASERQQVLFEWNQTESVALPTTTFQALFEAQTAATPDAVALVCGDDHLTYAALNQRANQLAHVLQAQGVGPDVSVALYLERSPALIAALLGVLKAGGAYVPLDPASPPERLVYVLADAHTALLISQESLLPNLPELALPIVCPDRDCTSAAHAPASNPPSRAYNEQAAYIIYTSGSTGQPKGVVIPQRALLNHVVQSQRTYALSPDDRVLQFASIAFDASVEEIFPTLASGATLVLRDEDLLSSPTAFWRACQAWQLTVLDLPTAFWHQLTLAPPAARPALGAVRLVIIGGERALPDRWAVWHTAVGPRPSLVNTYGPTEATVVATACSLTAWAAQGAAGAEVPIGRPVGNAQAYVLDRAGQPVPAGIVGELYIGGMGLAHGYLHRPDLTAERFVPHPFSDQPGVRLYRTGDLARYRLDGTLEFAGRADDQVKVRGYRIELGEIEAVLGEHPSLAEAVVIAREDTPGEKRLVAYVVPTIEDGGWKIEASGSVAPTALASILDPPSSILGELRAFLKQKLPDYMIPSAFVRLDALPLTPSGKLDRRALPAPDQTQLKLDTAFVAPHTEVESIVARIWADILGLERVGIRDNFFELGGHSLLINRMMFQIQEAFQIELAIRVLFERPTVEGLTQVIEELLLEEIEGLSEEEAAELAMLEGV